MHPATLTIEEESFYEPLVHIYQTKRHPCPVDRNIHNHRRKSLTFQEVIEIVVYNCGQTVLDIYTSELNSPHCYYVASRP
jgi:hypothetical protein